VHGVRSHAGGLGQTHDAERMILAQTLHLDILFVTKDMIDSGRALDLLAAYFQARNNARVEPTS